MLKWYKQYCLEDFYTREQKNQEITSRLMSELLGSNVNRSIRKRGGWK